ncbi:MAG: AI-2E family transporter [Synechococcales bacterium]|nr:AI-2E family transporter [Synechococcales bacterium]
MKFGQWLGLICLIIALVILWKVRQMLLLIFTAVVISTALNALVRQLQKLGTRSRGLAVMLTLLLVSAIGSLFIATVIPPFIDQFRSLLLRLPAVFTQLVRRLEALIENPPSWLPERGLQLELPDLTTLTQQLQPLVQNLLQNFVEFFNSSLTVVLQCLLVLALTLMLLANPASYRQAAIALFPSFYRRRADEILTHCEVALGNWLGGIFINSIFVAVTSGVGLSILGVDLVLAHALLAGLLNFIPNIGPVLSVVFPLSIALLGPSWKAIAVIILYVVIQNLESYWVSPMVMAKQVSLLPAVTLSAQVFFTTFFGLLGLILALPLTVVAKTWIQEALIKDILDQCGSQDCLDTLSGTLTMGAPPPLPGLELSEYAAAPNDRGPEDPAEPL